MLLLRELRYVAVDFDGDPAVQAGATLVSITSTAFLQKRGEAAVANVIVNVPAAPAIDVATDQVRLWVDTRNAVTVPAGRYLIRAVVVLNNGEVAQADVSVVVE